MGDAGFQRKLWTAFIIVYIVWGSTYLAIRVMVESVPPLMSAGSRFLVAGALMYFWQRAKGVPSPDLRQWGFAALTGTLLGAVGNGGVNIAETRLDSGITAVLVATVPLWLALFDSIKGGTGRFGVRQGLGIALGMAGVIVLAAPSGAGHLDPTGVMIILVATLGWSIGTILSKRLALPKSYLITAGMQMLCAGAVLLVSSVWIHEPSRLDPSAIDGRVLAALVYLVVFGSIVAFSAYSWLLRNAPASAVGTYAFVNPIVAVVLGAIVAGEKLGLRTLAGGAFIVAAAATLTLGVRKQSPPQESATPVTGSEA